MSKIDGRKISDKDREKIRFDAINDWLEGMKPSQLASKYGTSTKIVHEWVGRYKEGGWEGLKTKKGKTGPKPRLSPENQEDLRFLLRTKTPLDYGYQSPLWTCQIVADVIMQTFNVKYASKYVANLLHRMGFSPQKPRWGAWQQDKKKYMNG